MVNLSCIPLTVISFASTKLIYIKDFLTSALNFSTLNLLLKLYLYLITRDEVKVSCHYNCSK